MKTKHTTKMRLGVWTREVAFFLVVLAMLGNGSFPLFQKGLFERAEATLASDSCCPSTAETPARPSRSHGTALERGVTGADDCCPDGCLDCFLPCCHGPLAVYSETEVLACLAMASSLVPAPTTHPTPAPPHGLFRPPRG